MPPLGVDAEVKVYVCVCVCVWRGKVDDGVMGFVLTRRKSGCVRRVGGVMEWRVRDC